MNLIIFEDHKANGFYPLTVSHPVFDLLYGCMNAVDRLKCYFKPDEVILYCRDYLKDIASERHGHPANVAPGGDGDYLMINAALIPDLATYNKLKSADSNTAFISDNILIGARLSGEIFQKAKLDDIINDYRSLRSKVTLREIEAPVFRHLWEMVSFNAEAIAIDIKLSSKIKSWRGSESATKFDRDLYVHHDTTIPDEVFFDTKNGPIVIDKEAIIEPRSLIQGPAYIGRKSSILGGIIREGCSIGPVCKVGGELEESIILGYSNKSHEGFIGHSYIGEWVNLGALTTNSDLKNNYSNITVRLEGKDIPTGSKKIGCFIGDHSKTGIGTFFNTGIVIGFCNNLYGGSLFADKEIGHYKWGTPGNLTEFKLDKAISIAKSVMARRDREFTSSMNSLFERIFKM